MVVQVQQELQVVPRPGAAATPDVPARGGPDAELRIPSTLFTISLVIQITIGGSLGHLPNSGDLIVIRI
ncbi:hypothetical protein ABZ891_25785 [Streptomyces sp. NPDC047023]|uniref:hypothetical protein n=1 Tax=Streptomyces sp. NPDC047023 TaxID=3155139 RepID=UPI0033EEC6D2